MLQHAVPGLRRIPRESTIVCEEWLKNGFISIPSVEVILKSSPLESFEIKIVKDGESILHE